jgi:AraC-like DNA-binding protein
MTNDLYTTLTIVLATTLFVSGLFFYGLSRDNETPVFRTALRLMTFTYCFFGLINVLELWSRTFPDSEDILLLQTTTLIVAISQAFLFTYTLVLLIRPAYITRKRVMREILLILALSVALMVAYFILPAAWVKITVRLFILFYIWLLIKYTRLFVITYRECLRKLDNFFSGAEAEHLRWVNFSFYAALSIGVLALALTLLPAIDMAIFCSTIYLLFYLYFAVRIIKYGFVYQKLETALSEDDTQPEQPQEDTNAPHCRDVVYNISIEKNLKRWLDEKQYLQPGITIDDVAQYAATNRRYLSEHINYKKKKTFRQWINELRIDEAKNLLRQHPEMTVSDIAFKVGFINSRKKEKTFLAIAKVSPKIWRMS